jgi:hypothetical protein
MEDEANETAMLYLDWFSGFPVFRFLGFFCTYATRFSGFPEKRKKLNFFVLTRQDFPVLPHKNLQKNPVFFSFFPFFPFFRKTGKS